MNHHCLMLSVWRHSINQGFKLLKTRLLILLLSLCPSISYLHAVSADWNGGVDDFWGTAGNWSIAPAPGMGDTATFNAGDSGGATIIDFATIATLQVTAGSHSFSPGIGGLTANTVNVSTTGNTTFQSALLDIVNLTKTNSGILTLNGDNTIGAIAHDGGSLVLGNGSQTISNINQTGGTLNTAGNAAAITGNVNVATGTISPGGNAAIATLNITGNFTLGAAGIYELNILPTQTDLISATGTVTLTNGNTLNVKPLPGVYTRGTTYNIITGAGGVNGTITNLVEVHSLNFSTSVVDNDVVLTILQDTVMLPVPLSSLKGNSQVMGNYMFSNNRVLAGTPDLTNINNRLFSLSAEEFTSALIQLSPLASAAVPQATYQNDIQMAVVLDKQFQKSARKKPTQSKKKKKKEESEFSCYQTPKTGLFIEPIGVFITKGMQTEI